MKRYLMLYILTAIVFVPLDLLWLNFVAKDFYRSRLGDLVLAQPNLTPAILFYVFYVVGIVVFALGPADAAGEWRTALIYGALFGFFAYVTYDLTNLATLRGWSTAVTVVDIAWGTMLTGLASTAAFFIANAIQPGG
jgi:uncharacterized membrane protein